MEQKIPPRYHGPVFLECMMADEWITPIPRMVFFTKGTGRHKYRPQSLEVAFRHAGIEKFNLVQVSGILPPRAKSSPSVRASPACSPARSLSA